VNLAFLVAQGLARSTAVSTGTLAFNQSISSKPTRQRGFKGSVHQSLPKFDVGRYWFESFFSEDLNWMLYNLVELLRIAKAHTVALLNIELLGSVFDGRKTWKPQSDLGHVPHKW
jgi:hypothetical protein